MQATLLVRFGARVRELREQRGLSQERLAALSGLHRTYIGSVERAERNPTLKTMAKLAYALDMPLAELFAPFTEIPDIKQLSD